MIRTLAVLVLALSWPALAHDWYTGLSNDRGQICCNGRDCHPVPNCSSPGDTTIGVVIDGHCWPVDPSVVLQMYAPDGQTHACYSRQSTSATIPPHIRCVILPGSGV